MGIIFLITIFAVSGTVLFLILATLFVFFVRILSCGDEDL